MGAGALWALSLGEFMGRRAYAQSPPPFSPYGPISPKPDQATGLNLLSLPDGFTYTSYGWRNDVMSDGVLTPGLHDGMAVVDTLNNNPDWLVLVRNHEEDGINRTAFGNNPAIIYDKNAAGGTSNLVFDAKRGRFLKSWLSLNGCVRNCAGGVTPWKTWITGEETGLAGHGWCFDVGAQLGDPTPLTAMGRFSHEAMMVDPFTGIVYETEDGSDGQPSGFYKFVPNVYGQLKLGGQLYMLKVKGVDVFNFQPVGNATWPVGSKWDVEWVLIQDPTAASQSTAAQGIAAKAARFNRLEGCWWGDQTGYFLSTNGGPAGEGQVFEYNPLEESLKLIYVAPNANTLDNPDNITVTPRGGLLLCEDAAGNNFTAGERLIGLTLDGQAFTFGQNIVNPTAAQLAAARKNIPPPNPGQPTNFDCRQQEFAGACYSPDGRWLFCCIQTPGITFAITGPWGAGPL
jgi:secreted PhoX family phosphatase